MTESAAEAAPIEVDTLPSFRMFTFQDLVDEITKRASNARETKDSWSQLLSVAESLATATAAGAIDLLADQTWSPIRLAIQGHMGILNSDALVVNFDPTPGITVLHGPNGAGKSSISDAIETVLCQKVPPKSATVTGTSQIWEIVPVGRNFDAALIALTLFSNKGNRLHLNATIGRDGHETAFTSFFEGADGIKVPLNLKESWGDALTNHRPIFAYAALERKVQQSKDLAKYFENLLALGGCFTALDEEIERLSTEADQNLSKWQTAKNSAMAQISRIDARRNSEGELRLPAVQEPKISDDISSWVTGNFLAEIGELNREIPLSAYETLAISAETVCETFIHLESLNNSIQERLSSSLKTLHEQAKTLSNVDGTCPVCLTDDTEWLKTLSKTVEDFKRFATQDKAVTSALSAFQGVIKELLAPILDMVTVGETEPILQEARDNGRERMSNFERAITANGVKPQPAVLSATRALSEWIGLPSSKDLIMRGINQTEVTRQWRLERSKAVAGFVGVWTETQKKGSDSLSWKETKKRVGDLRGDLRKRNTQSLEIRVNEKVRELLDDVDLGISELTVLETKATMKLQDSTGNQLELGMLSAGQRNAILLAPLLASVKEGPFSFLILDDPVHAFDAMRIDRLSSVLAKLSVDRRVIVLTHDERLRTHLLASAEKCETRLVGRSVSTGAVTIEESTQLWKQLLEDARILFHMTNETGNAVDTLQGTSTSVIKIIRGLCRQSLDNALREFITRNSIASSGNYSADLGELDLAQTTRARMDKAQTIFHRRSQTIDPVEEARAICGDYLDYWNNASHGNEGLEPIEVAEIVAAEESCALLGSHQF